MEDVLKYGTDLIRGFNHHGAVVGQETEEGINISVRGRVLSSKEVNLARDGRGGQRERTLEKKNRQCENLQSQPRQGEPPKISDQVSGRKNKVHWGTKQAEKNHGKKMN